MACETMPSGAAQLDMVSPPPPPPHRQGLVSDKGAAQKRKKDFPPQFKERLSVGNNTHLWCGFSALGAREVSFRKSYDL